MTSLGLPSEIEIEQLHRRFSPDDEAFELIYTHCKIVWEIAQHMIQDKKLDVDRELVKAGCLLHDIGTYALRHNGRFDGTNYIKHGILGYNLLKDEGYDEKLCRIASHHTGVGLSKEDIKIERLPLPAEDFLAETIEEELVMYADKFHSKKPCFNSYASYMKKVSKFGGLKAEKFADFAFKFGVPKLEVLAEKYQHPIS